MISIIIPVYNVAEYLDECIESVVNQTYTDIEILLINDGSTDNSVEICNKWAKTDNRIRVIDKENEGQAVCRNKGVNLAKGEWIVFVDSDDWVDKTMVEKLYNAVMEHDVDMAICESHTQLPNGKYSCISLQELDKSVVNISDNPEFILGVKYVMWAKIFRKSFLVDNKITEPSIRFEDFACMPIILVLAKRIACVNEALYYYRYRTSSTMRDIRFIYDRFSALEYLITSFKKRDLFEKWNRILYRICTERAQGMLCQIEPILNKEFQHCTEIYTDFIKSNFSEFGLNGEIIKKTFRKHNYAVWGSYNSMIIAKMLMSIGTPDFLKEHNCFSSLISVISKADDSFFEIDLRHTSKFRMKHLVQDFTKSFFRRNRFELTDIDYFIIDLLEERFNIGEVNGSYFTISDAFEDVSSQIDLDYRVINKFSDEARNLWMESCKTFVEKLNKYINPSKIIIIRMFLCETKKFDDGHLEEFAEIEEIRKINKMLYEYYDYLISLLPQAIVVENVDDEYYYTDSDFKHGCYPWHLNESAFWKYKYIISDIVNK
ncbi:MAG: glycosyltransferase [Oscillospiraceae bacterium]